MLKITILAQQIKTTERNFFLSFFINDSVKICNLKSESEFMNQPYSEKPKAYRI